MKKRIAIAFGVGVIVVLAGSYIKNALDPSYNVLAGEMKIDMNGNAGFSVDKSKVAVSIRAGESLVIPITVKNNSTEAIKIRITQRTPDFVSEGYSNNASLSPITPTLVETVLPVNGQYSQGIAVTHQDSVGKIEIWVSTTEVKESGFAQEQITRLLITNAPKEGLN